MTVIYKKKLINLTNVHEHNDVLVSIKVQEFRSRYAKYVYYNCSRVVCECHGYKRDREPSRVPVNMLKRLSQKSKKLQSYVWSRLRKNVPKSSKVHRLIKNVVTRRKSRHKTRVRLVQKIRRKQIFRTKKVNSTMRHVNKSNTAKHGEKYFKYLRLFSCKFPNREYKSLTHRGNCTKYKLCNDVEENPGPVVHHVDPS